MARAKKVLTVKPVIKENGKIIKNALTSVKSYARYGTNLVREGKDVLISRGDKLLTVTKRGKKMDIVCGNIHLTNQTVVSLDNLSRLLKVATRL